VLKEIYPLNHNSRTKGKEQGRENGRWQKEGEKRKRDRYGREIQHVMTAKHEPPGTTLGSASRVFFCPLATFL